MFQLLENLITFNQLLLDVLKHYRENSTQSFARVPQWVSPQHPGCYEVFYTQIFLEDAEINKGKQISLPPNTRSFNMLMCMVKSLKQGYSKHFIMFFVPFSLASQTNVFHGRQFGKNLVRNM